jgi:hypothetical protein
MSTPTAIVIGSVIVAAGLYFGLRRPDPVAASVVPTVTPPPAPVQAIPPTVVPAATVARQASETLQYHRTLLRERCRPPAGTTARFTLNITFDAAGMQVIRGIVEARDNPPPGLGSCVNSTLPALRVPPPGAVTPVEVELSLP